MLRQKNAELHSIADVVCSNTGMTKEALLHDTHTYRIDGLETAAQIIRDGIKAGKIFYIMGDFDVDGIILKKWTAQEAADYIGKWAVEMTHDYFNTKLSPPKSATTQLTSTQYQPLFDTGRLYNSISYSVEGI